MRTDEYMPMVDSQHNEELYFDDKGNAAQIASIKRKLFI